MNKFRDNIEILFLITIFITSLSAITLSLNKLMKTSIFTFCYLFHLTHLLVQIF